MQMHLKVLPSQVFSSHQPSLPVLPRLSVSAPSSSQVASGVPAAASKHGCPYIYDVWKYLQLMKDACFAQCQLCRAQICCRRYLHHLMTTSTQNYLKKPTRYCFFGGQRDCCYDVQVGTTSQPGGESSCNHLQCRRERMQASLAVL